MLVRDQPYNIAELIDDLESRKISLPTLQRDFRWSKNQIAYFFDSIYQERPLGGQFHLWKPEINQLDKINSFSRAVSPNSKTKDNSTPSEYFIIDGQQRLTSLKKVFEGDVILYFDPIAETFHLPNIYRNSKAFDPEHTKNAEFVSVQELWLQSKPIEDAYADSFAHFGDKLPAVIGNLKKLAYKLRRLNFNCIVLDGHSEEQITEIFIILNNAGKLVNTRESVLFPLLLQILPGVRKEIDDFIYDNFSDLDDSDIGKIFDSNFIATALMYHFSRGYTSNISSFKNKLDFNDTKRKIDKEKLANSLEVVKAGILRTISFLNRFFGITTKNMVSTHFSLHVLILAFGQKIVDDKVNKIAKDKVFLNTSQTKGVKLYFLAANACKRYTGTNADSNRKNDIALAMGTDPFENLGKSVLVHKKSGTLKDTWFVSEDLKNVVYGEKQGKHDPLLKTLGIACYLMNAGKLTDGDERLDLSRAHLHHIYPQSVYTGKDIHNIANIAIVDKDANISKFKNRKPFDYMNDDAVLDYDQRKNLEKHFIPMNDKNQFEDKNFNSFISERKVLIAQGLSDLFKSLEN